MADIVFGRVLGREREREERVERRLADKTNPLELLTENQIFKKFRFRRETIFFIVGLIHTQLERPTRRNCALSPLFQVLITLRFLATGSFYNLVGDAMPRVSASSVCRVVWGVIDALLTQFNEFVSFPNQRNHGAIKQAFYSVAGFPNIIGAIDGTQIEIQAPTINENDFVNRKGVHAINCQMVCDPWMRITNVVAKWPGSVHDARIFRDSSLGRDFQAGRYGGILLGDSGYPCRNFLMVPYLDPQGRAQTRFNCSLVKTRVIIEQTFGVLKRKFACLKRLRVNPQKACKVICVAAMLHNIAIDYHDIDDEGDVIEPGAENIVYGGDDRGEGKHFRNHLARTYFS